MATIGHVLKETSISRLDMEVLLAHVLQVPRSYLHAYPERELTEMQQAELGELLNQYQLGKPVAYLTGHQEFWSLDLKVTSATLIPRPETELLIELILKLDLPENAEIADLGTGSGAIALALASEKSEWLIDATDKSTAALDVARANAATHHLQHIHFYLGDWCKALPNRFYDVIVSNPPYIAEDDPHLEKQVITFEPKAALIADNHGLADLMRIIADARQYLKTNGYLFVEHGFEQGENVRQLFFKAGYNKITTHVDLANLERVTCGVWEGGHD